MGVLASHEREQNLNTVHNNSVGISMASLILSRSFYKNNCNNTSMKIFNQLPEPFKQFYWLDHDLHYELSLRIAYEVCTSRLFPFDLIVNSKTFS